MPLYGPLPAPVRLFTCLFLLAASSATDVRAQSPVSLPPISVQGATLDVKPSGPAATASEPAAPDAPASAPKETVDGVPIEKVGSSVSVVTRADIERQQIRNAAEALRSLPGVSVSQSGTPGSVTVVRIRGAESRHTLVLIDGVEVNSGTDGFFDFSNLTADDIERIEVLRGPQSGLYGNGALGGVINITTKSGKGPLTLRTQVEGGSLNSTRLGAQLSGGNANAWGSISATAFRTSGFNISTAGDEKDGTRIGSFAFKGGFALSPDFKIEGNFREQHTQSGFDKLTYFPFSGVYRGFIVPGDAPYIGDARTRVAGISASLDTFGKRWLHNFYLQGADTLRLDTSTNVLETNSTNYKFGYKSTLLLQDSRDAQVRHYLTGLVERRTELFHQPAFSTTEYARHRNSFAGEIRGEYFKSLFLGVTLRHDQNDTTRDFTTWNVNGSYLVPGGVFRVHASAGTGVKYPSFGDLYGFFQNYLPNPALKPEEAKGYDFGIETKLLGGRAVVDVTYFHVDLQNEISITCPPPTFACSPYNLSGLSLRQGIEVSGRLAVTQQISLGAAYTYLHAREFSGAEEIRRPPHQGRVDVSYATQDRRGNVSVVAVYNGAMKDIATDTNFNTLYPALPDYWDVRLAASYKVQPGVEVFGRVENLFNQHYQQVLGYNATAGATAFAGVKLTFGGPDGVGGSFQK